MLVDYHVHALGHAHREHSLEELIPFLDVALKIGRASCRERV